MSKVLALLALCVAAASANAISGATITKKGPASMLMGTMGVVNPAFRCGGVGTPVQLRISECEGYCRLMPGTRYDCEEDFMPSSAAQSLTLRVEVCTQGLCFTILESELAGSSVQPGFIYTARYSIVPNDVFSGRTIEFRAYITHTETTLLEICVAADVDIL